MKGLWRPVPWVAGLALTLLIAMGSTAAPPRQWDYMALDVEGPGGVTLRAWVFRPQGSGPFPAIVSLHGGSGVVEGTVDRAAAKAREGFVTLVGCWSGPPYSVRFPELGPPLITCPGVPSQISRQLQAMENAVALIEAARRLPGVRPDRIGVIGGSAGGALAVEAATTGFDVQAVIALVGRYDVNLIPRLEAPLLLLHARDDAVIDVEQAIRFADLARLAGKDVQIYIYDSGGHHFMFEPQMKEDVQKRELEFLNRTLRR